MDKKSTLLIAALFAGCCCAFADKAPTPKMDVADAIVQIKAQEFSHALVELKLQEVALSHASPIDKEKLTLIRAQQTAINQELLKLAVAPLEYKLQESLKTSRENSPRNLELREKIELARLKITGEATPANPK